MAELATRALTLRVPLAGGCLLQSEPGCERLPVPRALGGSAARLSGAGLPLSHRPSGEVPQFPHLSGGTQYRPHGGR